MYPRHRAHWLAAVALLGAASLFAGCSRESLDDTNDAASTTIPTATSIAPPTSDPAADTTAPAGDSSSTTDPDDGGAFGHSEAELASFRAAYSQAFTEECERIWTSIGGGPLSDPDFPEDQYVVGDCVFELDETWGDLVDSIDEARSSGVDDAQIAASDLADPLCNAGATVCWSYGD